MVNGKRRPVQAGAQAEEVPQVCLTGPPWVSVVLPDHLKI